MQSIIRNKLSGDEITTETEMIDVTTIGPSLVADEHWQERDSKGHLHYMDLNGEYPTLKTRHWGYFCYDCHDTHEEFAQVCKQCGETIVPGTKPDPKRPNSGFAKEYTAGPTYYFLNGNLISKEEAERLATQWKERGEAG
jgi:hypothetical protein